MKTDRSWDGTYAEDLNFCEFETINVNAPSSGTVSGTGVYIKSDPAGSGRTDNVRLKEVNIQANGRGMNGMTLDGRVNGVVTDRFYALGVARGCQLVSSGSGAGNVLSFTELKSFQVDRASDCSMILDKSYVTTLDCPSLSNTSGILGTADGTTLQINANAITTIIQGGRIGNSQQSAVFYAGKGLYLSGCELMDISKSGVGARPIMEFAASARDFYVVGNKFKGFSRASNAVALNAAAADGLIKDNTWSALTTGAFNSGTGTNVDISNNKQAAHY